MPKHSIVWRGEVLVPPRIFCIGKNYADHVAEMGDEKVEDMVVFMKPAQSITDDLLEKDGEALHFEGEITFLLEGGEPKGVAFGFDLTKRSLQRSFKVKGLPWELSKAFRGSALFSEFVPLQGSMESLEVILEEDGKVIQQGRVPQMIHSPQKILDGLREFQDLLDGDLVMTGTPAGVGPVKGGATYVGRILSAGEELISETWVAKN